MIRNLPLRLLADMDKLVVSGTLSASRLYARFHLDAEGVSPRSFARHVARLRAWARAAEERKMGAAQRAAFGGMANTVVAAAGRTTATQFLRHTLSAVFALLEVLDEGDDE